MRNFDLRLLTKTPFIIFMLMFLGMSSVSMAQVKEPFKARYKTPMAIRGDFALLGNTVVKLSENESGQTVNHNGDGVTYVDEDNDGATINSSGATLVFSNENGADNTCTNVIYAGLYWTGRSASYTNSVDAILPDGTIVADRFEKDKIKFKKDGDSYVEIQADGILFPEGDPNEVDNSRGMYVGYANVTDYVKNNGDGVYFAADIATTPTSDWDSGLGIGYYGGWGLVVVYENPLMNTRHVLVYDGYAFVQGASSPLNHFMIDIDDFQAIQSGPVDFKLGIMAGEGDRVDTEDYFRMLNVQTGEYEALKHGKNEVNNFFNSSILTEGPRFPELEDNAGIDIAIFDVNNDNKEFIANNQSVANFEYGTQGDNYVIFNLAFAVDAYEPDIHPINQLITPMPPAGVFAAGSEVDFRLEIRNVGTEGATDGRVEIPFPDFAELEVISTTEGTTAEVVGDKLIWEIGDIDLPESHADVVAVMDYRLILPDCEDLLINGKTCSPILSIGGNFSGKGEITEYTINTPFIKEYSEGTSVCQIVGVPVYGDISFGIDVSECFDFSGTEDLEVCAGEDIMIEFTGLTGGIASYEWSVDNTAIGIESTGAGTISFVTVNTTDVVQVATVTVVPKTSFGCEGSPKSFTITVNPVPQAPAVTDITTYVGATGIEYDATPLPGHELVWFDENGESITPNEKPTVSTEIAGEFTAYVAQQHDETGCIGPIVPVMVFVKRVELSVEKTVDLTEIDGAGQLEYTITIENTGEFDLTDVVVSDVLKQQGAPDETISDIGDATQSGGDAANNNNEILEIGETWTYTFVYTVDQAQIDNGADLTNTVTVTTEQGASGDDEATTTITQTPSVSVDKSVDQDNIVAPATLNYTITVENTGNVSLTGITVTDAVVQGTGAAEVLTLGTPSGDTDNDGILDVGETWVYEISYAAEQSHIDNGNDVVNTFTFDAEELDTPASDEAVTTVTQSPSVSVEKTVDQDNIAAPATLNYTITVENTGNVSLTGITVTDAVVQGTGAAEVLTLGTPSGDTDNAGILDVGETWVYEISYAAEQSHIDNGNDIVNTFTFDAEELDTPASDEATTEITRDAGVQIEKSADQATVAAAGEVITYTITVTNAGNVTLENYTVTDVLFPEWSGSIDRLAPDATRSFELEYQVTQADIDNGGVLNVASVGGENPGDPEDEDEVEVPSEKQPGIEVSKTADKATVSEAGEVITYTITVTNTGNVTLENYTVTDVLFPEWSGSIDRLAPDATRSFELEYQATQADIDNGGVLNVASAGGENPDDPEDEDEVEVPSEKQPGVEVIKVADKATVSEAGEVITYTITVTNTGNVTLENYTVTDVLFPEWSGSIDRLAPDATRSFELEYQVTQADIDNGGVVNVASAGGENPDDPEDEDEVEVPSEKQPGVEVIKVADKATVSEAGEVITYTITVTNTGNVTLENYTVTDVLFPGWSGSIDRLAPDATRNFELEYQATQADIDNGGVLNVASAGGENPDDPEDEDEVEVPSEKQPGVEVIKVADKATVSEAGEVITYTITVTNTGNVTLRNYTVTDVLFPGWSVGIETLAPKAIRSFELEYTVTQSDIDGGGVVNVASVVGEDPGDPGDEDEVEVPVNKDGGIAITKVADRESFSKVGDAIKYTITVTNTGNVTLSGVVVTDVLFPDWSETVATLAPKAIRTFELIYTVSQSDVDNGKVLNVAHVKGEDPDGGTPEDEIEVEVPGVFGPVANNDEGTTQQGEPITITVLANDEAGSSPLIPESVRLVEPGTGNKVTTVTIEGEGTYTVDAAGKVIFTPDENFVGNSTITYTVEDENGLASNEATIAIIVEGVAAEVAPNAVDDTQTTPYGQPVTIDVLNNDVAGSSPIVPSSVTLIDGSGNRVNTVMIPGEGRYEVNAQGTVTFTPADGFTGASTIQYEITDENGLVSNPATITVTVNVRAFKIPNVFTPNGDGRNDVFEIVGIEGFDRVEITVVNRWGNEVYRNTNYRNNWDGQGLNEGTYYYVIITHDGGRQERYAGWVLIKKQ